MTRKKTHKDVEFQIELLNGDQKYFNSFDEAAGLAIAIAGSTGSTVNIDVIVVSKAGARWWGGDYAVEEYEFDEDASVFERIEVKANSLGRIP